MCKGSVPAGAASPEAPAGIRKEALMNLSLSPLGFRPGFSLPARPCAGEVRP